MGRLIPGGIAVRSPLAIDRGGERTALAGIERCRRVTGYASRATGTWEIRQMTIDHYGLTSPHNLFC
jgi:hypothetical protein